MLGGAWEAENAATGAPAAEAERTRGLGFGLSVARALLKALPNVGARAWLTLPRERLIAA